MTAKAVFRWRDAVLSKDCRLPSTARLVAVALSMYMDSDSLGNAFPGPAALAARTGLSPSTVKAQLAVLVREGWIEQTRRGGTDPGSSRRLASVYRGLPRPSGAPVRQKDGVGGGRAPVREAAGTRPAEGHHLVPDLDKDLGEAAPFESWGEGLAKLRADLPHLSRSQRIAS